MNKLLEGEQTARGWNKLLEGEQTARPLAASPPSVPMGFALGPTCLFPRAASPPSVPMGFALGPTCL
ncbi:MAG: hypothetical protein WAV47_02225, partial [Blastocatellia bacterium]